MVRRLTLKKYLSLILSIAILCTCWFACGVSSVQAATGVHIKPDENDGYDIHLSTSGLFSGDFNLVEKAIFTSIGFAVIFLVITTHILKNKGWKKGKKSILFLFLGLTLLELFILFPIYVSIFMILFFLGLVLYLVMKQKKDTPKRTLTKSDYQPYVKELPHTVENEEIKKECYELFLKVQNALSEFDYSELRKLVTDELYNVYAGKLDDLREKNYKRVLKDFEEHKISLVSQEFDKNMTAIKVRVEVDFYDYIIDENQKLMSGSNSTKRHQAYLLTFVYSQQKIDRCPSCGAKLEEKETVCSYCGTNILALGKDLRLSKKEALNLE